MRLFGLHLPPNLFQFASEKQRRADYVACFSTPAGQRVLDDILRRNFVIGYLAVHLDSQSRIDPSIVLLNEGRRSLALDIARAANEKLLAYELRQQEET